jgi:hypothetical protein
MIPKPLGQAATATPKTPESNVPSSLRNTKANTVKDSHKHGLNGNRRWWYIGLAVVTSLVALILGLSLGLTLGPRHADNEGKLLSAIDLGYSKYQGIDLQNGVNQWLGIRYAAAPIGDLRFTAPQDPTPNSTVQRAVKVCFASLACPVVTDLFEAWPNLLG